MRANEQRQGIEKKIDRIVLDVHTKTACTHGSKKHTHTEPIHPLEVTPNPPLSKPSLNAHSQTKF